MIFNGFLQEDAKVQTVRTSRRAWLKRRSRVLHFILNTNTVDERGSALVEFALILPMMLLLTTGVLVFGVAMNNYLQLTNAVSVGARTVALNSGITTDPCATASSAIAAAAPGLTSSKLNYSFTFNGNSQTGATCTAGAAQLTTGSTVTVTAQYPLNLSVFGTKFSANNAVLQATSSELVQ